MTQRALFGEPGTPKLEMFASSIFVMRDFLTTNEAASSFVDLRSNVEWREDTITVWGRRCKVPRLHAWMGPHPYSFSGLVMPARDMDPLVEMIRGKVEAVTGCRFNAVLLNFYRTGSDSVGWHADDEPSLGSQPAVATVSVGGVRTFQIRRHDKSDKRSLELEPGSLLFMAPGAQEQWHHQVPARARARARISLTFRNISPGG